MTLENSMNNWKRISALVVTAVLAAGAARAADLPYRKAEPVYAPTLPPAFSWTGFYAGANVGGGFSGSDGFNSILGATGKADGVVGGLQVGYNHQLSPRFVVGIENDFMASGLKTKQIGGNEVSLPFYGTGRARAGVTLLDGRLLAYGTGGMAFGQVKDAGVDKMRLGWTAGGGLEYAFQQNWSAKIEYLYTDLSRDMKKDNLPDREQKFQTVVIGVNYHF